MAKHVAKAHKDTQHTEQVKVTTKQEAIDRAGKLESFADFKSRPSLIKYLGLTGQYRFTKTEKKRFDRVLEIAVSAEGLEQPKSLLIEALASIDFTLARKKFLSKKQNKKKKPKRQLVSGKPDVDDLLKSRKNLPTIGLGTTPSTTIDKVKANEVVIDRHTMLEKIVDKHILYAAGWSLEGAFSK